MSVRVDSATNKPQWKALGADTWNFFKSVDYQAIHSTSTTRVIIFEADVDAIGIYYRGDSSYGVYSYLYADDVLIKQGNQGTTRSDSWTYFNKFDHTVHIKFEIQVAHASGYIDADIVYG